jgi:hypothetical protein
LEFAKNLSLLDTVSKKIHICKNKRIAVNLIKRFPKFFVISLAPIASHDWCIIQR